VIWALELIENKYKLLRQHMKFNLPTTTKALLENPTDTLDQIIKMVTQWDTNQVASHLKNAVDRKRDMGRHTASRRTTHWNSVGGKSSTENSRTRWLSLCRLS
jgi:hypothetical protein